MDESMKLVIGWTIVVAFVFTTGITCMSLVGWVRFAHKKQQYGLYSALILEVVVGGAGGATKSVRLDPKEVSAELKDQGASEELLGIISDAVQAPAGEAPAIDRDQLGRLVERIRVPAGSADAKKKDDLREAVKRLPAGRLKPTDVEMIRSSEILTTSAVRRMPPTR